MRAWMVPPHSAVVIRGTPGATGQAGATTWYGLELEEVSIGMDWHADEQR